MRTLRRWGRIYFALKMIEFVSIGILALLGASQKINPSRPPSWVPFSSEALTKFQAFITTAGIIAAGTLVITKSCREYIGHPLTWKQVQAILDQLQIDLFGDESPVPVHHHQITLLKYRKWWWRAGPWRHSWWWPWGDCSCGSGWLVPVARSGHGNQKTPCVFSAPDNQDKVEGIAGAAWALGKRGNMHPPIEDLPNIHADMTLEEKLEYARKTYVDVAWVDWRISCNKKCAQSYAGRPIEVKSEMWGVLVVDSRAPKLPNRKKLDDATATAAKLLDAVLEGT
jgi:hypothetical protein